MSRPRGPKLSIEEQRWLHLERELKYRFIDSWRCFGFTDAGNPNVLTTLYLRRGRAQWWRFDWRMLGLEAAQTLGDPPKEYAASKSDKKVPASQVIHGQLYLVAKLKAPPEKPVLVRALALVKVALAEAVRRDQIFPRSDIPKWTPTLDAAPGEGV